MENKPTIREEAKCPCDNLQNGDTITVDENGDCIVCGKGRNTVPKDLSLISYVELAELEDLVKKQMFIRRFAGGGGGSTPDTQSTIREKFDEDWKNGYIPNVETHRESKPVADYWLNKIKEVVGSIEKIYEKEAYDRAIHLGINLERQRILKEFGIIK